MKKLIRQNISLLMAIVTFTLTVVAMVNIFYAWFTDNSKVKATAVSVISEGDTVIIRDLMEVNRYLDDTLISDKWYHSDEVGQYYEWDAEKSEFILDKGEKIPLSVANVLPNEYIDITMWYMTRETSGDAYSIGIANMDDSQGIFTEVIGDEFYNHTALGVFRIGEVTEDENGVRTVDDDAWYWLAKYNGDTLPDTKYEQLVFKRGTFSTEVTEIIGDEEYYKTTFRIEMNLSQYAVLHYTTTNALSEKIVEIRSFRLFV